MCEAIQMMLSLGLKVQEAHLHTMLACGTITKIDRHLWAGQGQGQQCINPPAPFQIRTDDLYA